LGVVEFSDPFWASSSWMLMTSHQAFVGIENGIQVKDNKYPSDMRINKTPTIKKNTVNMINSI